MSTLHLVGQLIADQATQNAPAAPTGGGGGGDRTSLVVAIFSGCTGLLSAFATAQLTRNSGDTQELRALRQITAKYQEDLLEIKSWIYRAKAAAALAGLTLPDVPVLQSDKDLTP